MSFEYGQVRTSGGDQAVRQQMEQVMSGMEGTSGTLAMTPRGELLDSSISTPPGLDPTLASFVDQIEQQFGQLTIPFPEDPVTPGDSWNASTSLELSGLKSSMDATYTLRELDGDDYTIDVELIQTTQPGPIEGPNGQVVGEVIEGHAEGTGTVRGTLKFPFPTSGEVSTTGSTRMNVHDGTGDQEMVQGIEMTMRLEPLA